MSLAKRMHRVGAVLVAAGIVIALQVAPGTALPVLDTDASLQSLVELDLGLRRTPARPIDGDEWGAGLPDRVAATLIDPQDLGRGYSSRHEAEDGTGSLELTVAPTRRDLTVADLERARTALAAADLGDDSGATGPIFRDAVTARLIVSEPGRSDEPADVVVVLSRHVVLRVTARGTAADGSTALQAASIVSGELGAMEGYQELRTPSVARAFVLDALAELLIAAVIVAGIVGYIFFGPRGVIRRQREEENVVSNWSSPSPPGAIDEP